MSEYLTPFQIWQMEKFNNILPGIPDPDDIDDEEPEDVYGGCDTDWESVHELDIKEQR